MDGFDVNSGKIGRRSLQNRASTNQNNPLLSTSGASESVLSNTGLPLLNTADLTDAFVIESDGRLSADFSAPLPIQVKQTGDTGELPHNSENSHHLLALPGGTHPAKLEALALCVWPQTSWIQPGKLHLDKGTYLAGHWILTPERRQELGFRKELELAWELHCQPQRGAAVTGPLAEMNQWAQAFPEGVPIGSELQILDTLLRVAKRLGGAIRIADTGVILEPDGKQSVNLRLFSPLYLDYTLVEQALRQIFFGSIDLQIPPGVENQVKPPYAFFCDDPESHTQAMISVSAVEVIPPALRWEQWAKDQPFLCYDLQWLGQVQVQALGSRQTRSGPRRIALASEMLETTALSLAELLPADARALMDEDGFLISLDVQNPTGE